MNNLAPGMVLTPFNQKAVDDPEVREKQVQSIPMKRAAQPEEIAELALFLASDKCQLCYRFNLCNGWRLNAKYGSRSLNEFHPP